MEAETLALEAETEAEMEAGRVVVRELEGVEVGMEEEGMEEVIEEDWSMVERRESWAVAPLGPAWRGRSCRERSMPQKRS